MLLRAISGSEEGHQHRNSHHLEGFQPAVPQAGLICGGVLGGSV